MYTPLIAVCFPLIHVQWFSLVAFPEQFTKQKSKVESFVAHLASVRLRRDYIFLMKTMML